MIKGDYDYLTNLAKYNVCAEHKTLLVVAWHSEEKAWVLRCDEGEIIKDVYVGQENIKVPGMPHPGHYPDAITRELSLTELYRQGEELPSFIEDNIKKSQRRRDVSQGKQPTAVTMGGVSTVDLGTGELLVPEVVKALVEYAQKYRLDPGRGHVVLMYSKPYITIDGYFYHANQTRVAYKLESQPLNKGERIDYGIGEKDFAWLARVTFDKEKGAFTGLGVVTQEEREAKSPRDATKLRSPVVAAHPWQLAQKRAEWQALRRAFPIGETEEE